MHALRLIDFLIDEDKEREAKFLEVGLLRYHHNISEDFNYLTQVDRAVLMGQPKSAEIILSSFKVDMEIGIYSK